MPLFPATSDPPRSESIPDVYPAGPPGQTQCAVIQAGGCRLELHIHIHQGGVGGPAVSVNQVQQQAGLFHEVDRRAGRELAADQFGQMSVFQLLQFHGVRRALRFVHLSRERVELVLRAAKAKRRVNLGGWIAEALSKGWSLDEYNVEGDQVSVGVPLEGPANG